MIVHKPSDGCDHDRGRRDVLGFVGLLFALSGLFWSLAAVVAPDLPGAVPTVPAGFDPIVTLGTGFLPGITAILMVCVRGPLGSLTGLLRRAATRTRIRLWWWLPVLLLNPLSYLLADAVTAASDRRLPSSAVPVALLPVLVGYLLLEAIGEELGWTAFLTDPLLRRWGVLGAGVLLGVITGVWHVVPSLQAHQGLGYLGWLLVRDLPWRVLGVWLYVNTGRSVLAVLVYHVTDNLGFVLIPTGSGLLGPAVVSGITLLSAAVVVTWGSGTLAARR